MSPVTIVHVAREAGVSISTVSRVINGVTTVSEDIHRRVVDAVNRLHYQPNPYAQWLASRRREPATMVIPDIGSPAQQN